MQLGLFSLLDLIALAGFALAWGGYAAVVEWTRHGGSGLNGRMVAYRETWMRRMLAREQRMVDMQIMAALQNGTAFFATTSLFAIGGALSILRSSDEMVAIAAHLPLGIQTSRGLWEAKAIGLTIVFVYAFFKFAWAYRLYNYVAILLGATPPPADKDTPEAQAHVLRTARLFTTPAGTSIAASGRSFSRSVISAGSRARSCSWRRPLRCWW